MILCISSFTASFNKSMTLESIFSAKTLVTVVTRERLDSKMYTLVSLQVVVTAEALWALITLKWTVLRRVMMAMVVMHTRVLAMKMHRVGATTHSQERNVC
jgi:hypothetical protein